MIFSRARGGRHSRAEEETGGRGRHAVEEPEAGRPEFGPYDISHARPDGIERFDMGALRIPMVSGVEVGWQASPEGHVQQAVVVYGPSALQLGVFAAPRTDGIWDEVRADIRKSLFADGVAAEEVDGEYGEYGVKGKPGVELRARVRNPEGLMDIRFVGVDGPRWFVRAVYQGPAAVDPADAEPLREVLRGLVVDRGDQAMPVKEALPLRLPEGIAEQAAAQAEAEAAGPGRSGSGQGQSGPGQQQAGQPVLNLHGGTPNGSAGGGADLTGEDRPRRKPSPRPRKREA